MAEYYYSDGNQKYGPYSVSELRSKSLEPETLVWHERLPDWTQAADLPELGIKRKQPQQPPTPPPLPPGGKPRKSPRIYTREEERSFAGILRRYRWVIGWCVFHTLAWILSANEVKYFNTTGAPRTEKFWPFVKYTDAYFTKVQSEPQEVWKTQVVFNGFFTQYDWSEYSFYIGAALFVVILMVVYRRTS